jgi:DNA-binding transcriptional regulator YhcF (GntR family)
MDFKNNKTIFLQIAERICDEILLEKYRPDERIPSVREYASIVEVNFNTVMRSFEYLQQAEIIFNKRGIGYFVSPDAKTKILAIRKTEFLENEIYDYFKQIFLLDIPMEEITEKYNQYVKQQEK